MKSFTLAIFIACFIVVFGEKARYDNYRVYSVKVETENQLKVLHDLEKLRDGILFMELPHGIQQTADIIVPPHKFADISELFETHNMKNELKTKNLQQLIDEKQPRALTSGVFGWDDYYNLDAVYEWLDQLLEQYPDKLTNYEYGKSYENRTLRAVKVSHKKGKPTIFIESTIHAREWITTATTTYFLNELLNSTDPEIRNLADSYDWIIVPVANVDGYEYTHTRDRMWRKTRQPHPKWKFCKGADPNRNWDFHHAEAGTSSFPCSDMFPGPKPFSEPEVLALSEFIKTVDNLKLYMSFHSFSQLILMPYGHTKKHVRNYDEMKQIALKGKSAISQRYGTSYKVGNVAEIVYPASGSSIDWVYGTQVYGTQNVSLAYGFEFRDKGRYGFFLPPNQIIPNSLEIIDGLIAMVKEAQTLQYL